MVAEQDAVGAGVVHLPADIGGDTEAVGRVLAVDRDEIEIEPAPQVRQIFDDRIAAGPADNVAAIQQSHGRFRPSGRSGRDVDGFPFGDNPVEPRIVRLGRNGLDFLGCKGPSNRRY